MSRWTRLGAVTAVADIMAESPAQREALMQFLFSGRFDPVIRSRPGWIGALKQTARAVVSAS